MHVRSSIVYHKYLIGSNAARFEWIVGGGDPRVYVNTGVNIAKTGAIVIRNEPVFDGISKDLASDFLKSFMGTVAYPGFYFERHRRDNPPTSFIFSQPG